MSVGVVKLENTEWGSRMGTWERIVGLENVWWQVVDSRWPACSVTFIGCRGPALAFVGCRQPAHLWVVG
jgi:hypothetical protein